MPTYEIQAPDGNKYRIDGPPGATQDQVRAKVLEQHPTAGKLKAAPESLAHKAYEATGLKGITEAADIAASTVSGGVGSLAGGIVKATGYAREGVETALTGHDPGNANAAGDKLANALTWAPKTDKGKAVMADIAKGLQKFEDWSDKQGSQATQAILAAGDKAGEVAKRMGAPQSVVDFIDAHKEQVAAAYGAATKTTINAVPLVLGGELTKLPGKVLGKTPEAAAVAPEPPAPAPPVAAPAAPPADLTLAPSAPRAAPGAPAAPVAPAAAPPLTATAAPRGTPNVALEGASLPPSPTVTPQARAQAYVRDRLGLSWDALADATKRKLETVAAKAGNLEKLNPEAVKRQAHLEREGFGRKPISTTAGKLERDNAALLREQGAAATPSGRSIVDTDVQTNRDLRGNIETLVERLRGIGTTRATATSREQVGAAVAGREKGAPGALTLKQAKAKAATRAAYEEARKTEPDATVPADPMYEFVRGNPEVLNPQIQHLSWLNGWLKKAGIEKLDESGAPTGDRRPINAKELDDLRKKAGKMAGGTGDSAHYAKEVLTTIDAMFDEGLPAAAAKWKAARSAHAAERGEFANQGAIERLVGTKGGNFGTDPKTALEDVWKASVKNGKLEEIRQLKRSLLSGDAETRVAGKKALRELKAETGRDMLREITKGVSTNIKGETNITAEAINNWIKGMGGGTVEGGVEKLNVILGRRATNELMRIREDAQITKTEPTVRNVGSNTFQKILNWMDDTGLGSAVKKIPGAGPLAHLGESALKHVENVKAVRRAGQTATSEAERAGAKAQAKRADQIQREQTRGRIPPPPTYGAQ